MVGWDTNKCVYRPDQSFFPMAILLTSPRFQYSVLCGSQLPLSNVPRLNLNTPAGDPYGQDNTLFSLMALQLRFSSDPSVEKRGAKLKVSSDNGRCTKERKSYIFLDNRWRVFFNRRLIIYGLFLSCMVELSLVVYLFARPFR